MRERESKNTEGENGQLNCTGGLKEQDRREGRERVCEREINKFIYIYRYTDRVNERYKEWERGLTHPTATFWRCACDWASLLSRQGLSSTTQDAKLLRLGGHEPAEIH